MKPLIYALFGLAATVALVLAAPARAQTANDVNRLNAAIQICNSPMGAGTPECARLRGQLGTGAVPGAGGGGTASALAGLLGGAMAGKPAPAPAAAAPAIGIDINSAITNCVAKAAGDQAQIQRCLAIASGGAAAKP